MSKIFLKIYLNNLVDSNQVTCKYYNFSVSNVNKFKDEYLSVIMKIKSEGIFYDTYFSNDICYIDLGLGFYNYDKHQLNNRIIIEILSATKKILESFEIIEHDFEQNGNSEKKDDGILVFFQAQGDGCISEKELVCELEKINLMSKKISESNSIVHMGCSGKTSEFLYYLSSIIASGIAWDEIKFAVSQIIELKQYNYKPLYLDRTKFNKLKKEIMKLTNEISQYLVLVNMKIDNKNINFEFKASKGTIHVICDSDYRIIDYQYEYIEN